MTVFDECEAFPPVIGPQERKSETLRLYGIALRENSASRCVEDLEETPQPRREREPATQSVSAYNATVMALCPPLTRRFSSARI